MSLAADGVTCFMCLQVWKNIPDAHVLACAPSNSAADLIAERLIKHVPESQIFRMHAVSRIYKSIPEAIRVSSKKYLSFVLYIGIALVLVTVKKMDK